MSSVPRHNEKCARFADRTDIQCNSYNDRTTKIKTIVYSQRVFKLNIILNEKKKNEYANGICRKILIRIRYVVVVFFAPGRVTTFFKRSCNARMSPE